MTLSIIGLQPTLPTRVMGLRTIVLFIIVYRIVFLFTIFQSYTIWIYMSILSCYCYCCCCRRLCSRVNLLRPYLAANSNLTFLLLLYRLFRILDLVGLPACLFGLSTPSGFSLSQPHYSFPTRPLFNNAHQCDIHTSSTYIRIYIFILFIYPNEFYCKSKYWALWSASISVWDLRSVIRNLN